ncbi:tonB-dependent receptor family protein [Asticcacaulis biprosthecium C19]|uniref:TonB-dependent receptor family protein n=2 Tax=Asticcacaulis biprosthecium TaxID=76891 RepID=F4QHY5_9CAUL|nr:tonB-dependent receptor family protein [Asticcacaulis biprosthecium C19]
MAAASFLALGTATAVSAQDAPAAAPAPVAGDDNVVVVRGFRASLQSSLNTKKNSNLIIESVTAEDMGKFPDQNIAESLQRLPGIQIDRENGQGTKVRIRGLDQNVTVLNNDIFVSGMEIFRLGEGNIRQDASLEGIPSELIGGVDVYKSPDASLLEGGLGGIVNLKTRSPRAVRDMLFSGDIRLNKGGEGDATPVGSLVFGKKFGDRFGLLATVSYDRTDIHTDVLGGENRGGWRLFERPTSGGTATVYSPEYRYATNRNQERERIGFSLSGEFHASDSLTLTGDWFHSDLSILTSEASLKFPFANEGATYAASSLTIDSNRVLQSGTVTANSAESITFVQNGEVTTDNVQFAAKWDNGGTLTGTFRAALSKADYESSSANADVRYTQYGVRAVNGGAGITPNSTAPATFTFSYKNGDLPSFSAAGPNATAFTNPAMVFAKSHWAFGEKTDIENTAVSADFKWRPDFAADAGLVVSFGARFAERTVDSEYGRYLADLTSRGELPASAQGKYLTFSAGQPVVSPTNTTGSTFINWTPYGYFMDGAIGLKWCDGAGSPCGRFGDSKATAFHSSAAPYDTAASNPGRFEQVNILGINALVNRADGMTDAAAWISKLYPETPFKFFRDPLESFQVEEKTTTGYMMADVGERGDRFHLNAGVRVVKTELAVTASSTPVTPLWWGTDSWNGILKNPDTGTTVREYTDVLPSASAVFDLNESDKLRASAARVVSRQNLFQLGQGSAYDFTRSSSPGPNLDKFLYTSGSGGNPNLDPYRASQYDVAYERYFGQDGFVSGGFFYKSVDSFIQTDTISVCVADQSAAGCTSGPFSAPVNGEGGTIKGVELAAQYAFDNGFGFTANYTYSDSESSNFNDFDDNLPIPGVSKHAYNIQGFYEGNGFEARVSYAWRDKAYYGNFGFGSGAAGGGTVTAGTWERAYGQLDAQVGYSITPKLKVTLEGINLTEESTGRYLQFENLPLRYASGERRIILGLRYNFGN